MIFQCKVLRLTTSFKNACEGGRLLGALTLDAVKWMSLLLVLSPEVESPLTISRSDGSSDLWLCLSDTSPFLLDTVSAGAGGCSAAAAVEAGETGRGFLATGLGGGAAALPKEGRLKLETGLAGLLSLADLTAGTGCFFGGLLPPSAKMEHIL